MSATTPLPMRKVARAAVLACALWTLLPLASAQAPGLPEAVAAQTRDWKAMGDGELRWFGFRVYRAALWGPGERWSPAEPFALALRYQRAIPGARLVESSLDEMRRLDVADEQQLKAWAPKLAQAFPDVERDDVIVGLSLPGEGAEFYFGERRTARIDDPAFAEAFFAIWLDPRTREPGLRARLTGGSGGGDG